MRVSAFMAANLGLAFALELTAFGALGYEAFKLVGSTAPGALLAVGTLVTATALWGLFAAPRAPLRHPLGPIDRGACRSLGRRAEGAKTEV